MQIVLVYNEMLKYSVVYCLVETKTSLLVTQDSNDILLNLLDLSVLMNLSLKLKENILWKIY